MATNVLAVGRAACLAGLVLLAGCWATDQNGDGQIVVLCIGDSNTDAVVPNVGLPKWCEQLAAAHPSMVFLNRGAYSSFAITAPPVWPFYAEAMLDETRRREALPVNDPAHQPWADVVLMAWGTNDIRVGILPTDVRDALADRRAELLAEGRKVGVLTLTPTPLDPAVQAQIDATNGLLSGMGWSLFNTAAVLTPADMWTDGVHLNAAGQTKVANVISPAL